MKKFIIMALVVSFIPVAIFSANTRGYNVCTSSSGCDLYYEHGIFRNFNSGSSSYISSRVTKKDSTAGGFVNAELFNYGSSNEFGSLIDRYGASLNANGEWVQVHYNSATHNKTYVAAGSTQLSASHKMKASVE